MIDEVSDQDLYLQIGDVSEGEVLDGVAVEVEVGGDFKVYGVYEIEDDVEVLVRIEIDLNEEE